MQATSSVSNMEAFVQTMGWAGKAIGEKAASELFEQKRIERKQTSDIILNGSGLQGVEEALQQRYNVTPAQLDDFRQQYRESEGVRKIVLELFAPEKLERFGETEPK